MDFLAQAIIPYVLLYKYWALFILTFFASSSLPIPAGTLLIASSAFASQGYFKVFTLLVVVLIANIIGDNLLYWVARLYGKKILSKINFVKRILNSENYLIIEKKISKKPGFIIIISRFEVIATLLTNLLSGMSKVPYKKFLKFEIIGTFGNVFFYFFVGYSFGNSWQAVNKLIGDFSIFFFLMIALIISIFGKKVMNRLSKNI